jgi:hypothetical protein
MSHFGEFEIVPNEAIEPGDVWLGRSAAGPSPRLLEAFTRGEVTEGGMAEAGWRYLGRIADGDGPVGVGVGEPAEEKWPKAKAAPLPK